MEGSSDVLIEAVRGAPAGWGIVAVSLLVAIFIVVKMGLPQVKELRSMRIDAERQLKEQEMEVERYRIEVEERKAQALDERERERIRTTQAQVEQARQSDETLRAINANVTASMAHTDVLVAELRGARDRSREMGGKVERIDQTTSHTDGLVEEIHRFMIKHEGTD